MLNFFKRIWASFFIPEGNYCYVITAFKPKIKTHLCKYFKDNKCLLVNKQIDDEIMLWEHIKICGINEENKA